MTVNLIFVDLVNVASMDREADQMKIKQLLTATIASLCNNSLSYNGELSIQGLLGITIDRKDILLVNINETLGNVGQHQQHQTVVDMQAELSQTGSLQLVTSGREQNCASDNSVVGVRQKQAVNTGKSTLASKNRVSTQINRADNSLNFEMVYFPKISDQ